MSYKSRLRKNLRDNIHGFNEDRRSLSTKLVGLISKICLPLGVLSLPVFLLSATSNFFLRIPDIYSYTFTRLEVSSNMRMDMTDSELGKYISNFFLHKNQLDLVTYFQGIEQRVFTDGDISWLTGLRGVLDDGIVLGIVSLIVFIACIIFLVQVGTPRYIRYIANASLPLGILTFICLGGAIAYGPFRQKIIALFAGYDASSGGNLIAILDAQFYYILGGFIAGSSIVLLILVFTFIKKRTKKSSMFDI